MSEELTLLQVQPVKLGVYKNEWKCRWQVRFCHLHKRVFFVKAMRGMQLLNRTKKYLPNPGTLTPLYGSIHQTLRNTGCFASILTSNKHFLQSYLSMTHVD